MLEAIGNGLFGLVSGFVNIHWSNPIMIVVGCILLYLGIKKDFEPLLLVPIGFGCILVNIPLAGLMEPDGFLRIIYEAGVITELFPLFIFVGIGAMTDFGPLLENPKIFLLGAAGQFGIFLTLALALALGFTKLEAVSIGIIGACDGPTAIYVTSKYAPHLLGAVSVAAYSYMSLVPVFQPPIMRWLTTDEERKIVMAAVKKLGFKNDQASLPPCRDRHRRDHRPQGTPSAGHHYARKLHEGIRGGEPALPRPRKMRSRTSSRFSSGFQSGPRWTGRSSSRPRP